MVIYSASGVPVIAIDVDDDSYRYREIMGDNKVYLQFALTMHVEIVPGSYIQYQGETYTLMTFQDVTIRHNRDFEYKATFEGPTARFRKYRVHNLVDGRLKFDMIATPREHLQLVVGNLCEREGVGSWVIGDCIEGKEILVSYNHTRLDEALNIIADACGTEWSGTAGTVSLCRVEYNADAPLALGYGRNLGFRPGVGRLNYGEFGQIQKVYIQGSDRNIFLKDYGNATLLLPKNLTFYFDGEKFKYTVDGTTYTETGFDQSKAVAMVTDTNGFSVRLYDSPVDGNEDSLDVTEVYPKRVGKVTDVRYEYNGNYYTYAQLIAAYPNLTEDDWLEIQVDIFDDTIPSTLDFHECLPNNDEPLTVIFQSGILSGREFNATFYKQPKTKTQYDGSGNPSTVQVKPGNRFELEKASIDGFMMPGGSYRPNAGSSQDDYIVTNVSLPQAYICDYATFEGAELDALRAAAKHLYANKDAQFTFKGEVDDLYAKRNWLNIGAKLILGGCISFSHPQVQSSALVTRITAIKDYINKPYSPEITLSNETVKGGLSSRLSQMDGATEHVNRRVDDSIKYTKRSWYNAKESQSMLEKALLQEFTNTISPIAVNTMQMLVGSESLQYSFIYSLTDMTVVGHNMAFDSYGRLVCPLAYILHHTMGITSVQPNRPVTAYMRWTVAAKTIAFTDEAKPYYLYIKAQRMNSAGTGSAEFVASETPIGLEDVSGYWHFLYATIGSVSEGERSIVTCNGFTEVTPGRVTAYQFLSPDGNQGVDFLNGIFRFQKGNKLFLINMSNGHDDIKFSGVLIESQSGDTFPITCYRGDYLPAATYYYGDEVTHGGSSWLHVGETATTGVEPGTNSSVWTLKSGKGQSTFKSTVFVRMSGTPTKPANNSGSYSSPSPNDVAGTDSTGATVRWSDGIPVGKETLWASTRIFTDNGLSPQQSSWSDPKQMTDTETFDVEFAKMQTNDAAPALPTTANRHGGSGTQVWFDPDLDSSEDFTTMYWRAERECVNGVWGSWTIVRIKGEKGDPGTSVMAQYSADGSTNWHSAFAATDIYMRTSTDGGQTWGNAIRIVGETGAPGVDGIPGPYMDYSFAYSPNLSSSQQDGCPTDSGTDGSAGNKIVVWNDAPPSTHTAGWYLWMRVVDKEYDPGDANADQDGYVEVGSPSYVRIGGENGTNGTNGTDGKIIRGVSEWTAGGWDGSGAYQGEADSGSASIDGDFIDVVTYPPNSDSPDYYWCLRTHLTSSSGTTPGASGSIYWKKMNSFQLVATKALIADRIAARQVTIDNLNTGLSSGATTNRILISGNKMNVENSSGDNVVQISGGNEVGQSDGTGSFTKTGSYSGSVANDIGYDAVVFSGLAVQYGNNKAAATAFNCILELYEGNTQIELDQEVAIYAYLQNDTTGEIKTLGQFLGYAHNYARLVVDAQQLGALSAGSWRMIVHFEIQLEPEGQSMHMQVSSVTVSGQYKSTSAFTKLAGNGFHTVWSGEGFKATSNGAKVIQDGVELNAVGFGALNGLTAPKKFIICTSVPGSGSLDENAFYLKVSSS